MLINATNDEIEIPQLSNCKKSRWREKNTRKRDFEDGLKDFENRVKVS
jgi:hypothetical protein